MIDKGQATTIIISIIGAFAAAIVADPSVLQPIMGNEAYIRYIGVIIIILGIISNINYPRNEAPLEEAPDILA